MATKQQAGRLDFLLQASNIMVSRNPTLARFYMSHYQETLRLHQLSAPKAIHRLGCPRCGQIYLAGYNTSVELVPKGSTSAHHDKNDNQSKIESSLTHQRSKKNRKNTLVYTCHACQYRRKFNGSFKRYIPSATATESEDVPRMQQTGTMDKSKGIPVVSTTNTVQSTKPINTSNHLNNKSTKKNVDQKKQNTTTTAPVQASQQQQQQQQQSKKQLVAKLAPHKQETNKRPSPSTPQLSKKKSKKNQLQSLLAGRKEQKDGGSGSLGLDDFLSSL